jgi:hypothetical protein
MLKLDLAISFSMVDSADFSHETAGAPTFVPASMIKTY